MKLRLLHVVIKCHYVIALALFSPPYTATLLGIILSPPPDACRALTLHYGPPLLLARPHPLAAAVQRHVTIFS